MKFQITLTPSVEEDIQWFKRYEQKIIAAGMRTYLAEDADIESDRRKKLRPNPLAPWELKMGNYRVFYDLKREGIVKVIAVGYKRHNSLYIRGKRVEL